MVPWNLQDNQQAYLWFNYLISYCLYLLYCEDGLQIFWIEFWQVCMQVQWIDENFPLYQYIISYKYSVMKFIRLFPITNYFITQLCSCQNIANWGVIMITAIIFYNLLWLYSMNFHKPRVGCEYSMKTLHKKAACVQLIDYNNKL